MKRTATKRRKRAKVWKSKAQASHLHFRRATRLEARDAAAARAAYEACLQGDCAHLEASINLARLLHAQGLVNDAEALYRGSDDASPILCFNLGLLLEDLEREVEAIEAYREALSHDPGMADAHLNLSLIHSRRGEAQPAFRHLLAYRRLNRLTA